MGYRSADLAYARWAFVSGAPFRVLVFMALRCNDDDRLFWGGRDALALALGRMVDGGMTEADQLAAYRAVARTVATLEKLGAITRVEHGRNGHNAVYRLNF